MAQRQLDQEKTKNNSYVPEFLNSAEKYNKCIRKTNTAKKYEAVLMKLAFDRELNPFRLADIAKQMQKDLFMVHNMDIFSYIYDVVEGIVKYLSKDNLNI